MKRNLCVLFSALLLFGLCLTAGAEETESGGSFLYENCRLGYAIKLPDSFAESCSIISHRTEDLFVFDKAYESGFGGNLLYIAAVDKKNASAQIEFMSSGKILFQNETYLLIAGGPTDVQFNWEDQEETQEYRAFHEMCQEALYSVRTEEIDYRALAHIRLDVSRENQTFSDRTESGVSLHSTIEAVKAEGEVWEGEFEGLNQNLQDLIEEEREEGLQLFNDHTALFSGEEEVTLKVSNEVMLANEKVMSLLTCLRFESGGTELLKVTEGHAFRTDGGIWQSLPLCLHDLLRNDDRFYQALMEELSSGEDEGILLDTWRNQAAAISENEAEAEEVPDFYVSEDGLHLLFQGRSAEKIFRDPETLHEVFLSFEKDMDIFSPYLFDYGDPERIEVHDAEELLDAIGSNRVISLAPGTYNLTQAMEKYTYPEKDFYGFTGRVALPAFQEKHPSLSYSSGKLSVRNVTEMTLESAEPGQETRIVVDDAAVSVLSFGRCDNITLRNLTLGHETEPGTCSGSVLTFHQSSFITLEGMDLFGSGAYGIEATETGVMTVRDTEIHDCTYGIMSLAGCYAFEFLDSAFRDNREYTLISLDPDSTVRFSACSFMGNEGPLFSLYENEYPNVTFEDCAFGLAEKTYVEANERYARVTGEIRDLKEAPMEAEG